jgi:voltage-dependent calcium channel L type alpha-1D
MLRKLQVGFHRDHNDNANFRTFWHAVLTLIRFSTGENWNGMMHSLANNHNMDCVDDPEYDKNMCGFNNVAGCEPMNG